MIFPNGVKLLDARKAITEWLAERPQTSGYLFPNPQALRAEPHQRLSVSYSRSMPSTAGLPEHKSAPHAMKHSLGQHLHDSGQPIEIVAACLGHARIDSSRRYFDISFTDANHARRAAINYRG